MDAPPSMEATSAGASPCGGAPAMDTSTDGGASTVDASLLKKNSLKMQKTEERRRMWVSGGGTAVVA